MLALDDPFEDAVAGQGEDVGELRLLGRDCTALISAYRRHCSSASRIRELPLGYEAVFVSWTDDHAVETHRLCILLLNPKAGSTQQSIMQDTMASAWAL